MKNYLFLVIYFIYISPHKEEVFFIIYILVTTLCSYYKELAHYIYKKNGIFLKLSLLLYYTNINKIL